VKLGQEVTYKRQVVQYQVYGCNNEVRVYDSIRELEASIVAEEICVRLVDLKVNGVVQHKYIDLAELGQACGKGCRQSMQLTF
jgi:hypothetical protein